MKIGFPVLKKDTKEQLKLAKNLHSSQFIGIYNPETEEIDIKQVNDFQNSGSGADLMQRFVEEEIEMIVSPEFHPMAAKYFADHGINLYKAESMHAMTSLSACLQEQLDAFNENNIIQRKSCSSECGSCSSTCSEDTVNQELVAI